MGIAFVPFFGDLSKDEIEKEIKKVDEQIADLEAQKRELKKALEAHDSSAKG